MFINISEIKIRLHIYKNCVSFTEYSFIKIPSKSIIPNKKRIKIS